MLDTQKSRVPIFKIASSSGKETATALEAITRWLKWHDSKIFWDRVEQRKHVYIAGQIRWGEKLSIFGYLDFGQALRDERCAFIAQTSFIRAWAVFEGAEYLLTSLDPLTKRFISPEGKKVQRKNPVKLGLGSVYLTGTTQQNTPDIDTTLNFFIHPDAPQVSAEMYSLLHWLSRQQGKIVDITPKFKFLDG